MICEPWGEDCDNLYADGCGREATYATSRHGVRVVHIVKTVPFDEQKWIDAFLDAGDDAVDSSPREDASVDRRAH
jgi:hypothetical protein